MSYFWIAGVYFGYPDCCIEAFHERMPALRRGEELPIMPLDGTGYVPCLLCAATYTDEELIARIEERRVCPTPFPEGELP